MILSQVFLVECKHLIESLRIILSEAFVLLLTLRPLDSLLVTLLKFFLHNLILPYNYKLRLILIKDHLGHSLIVHLNHFLLRLNHFDLGVRRRQNDPHLFLSVDFLVFMQNLRVLLMVVFQHLLFNLLLNLYLFFNQPRIVFQSLLLVVVVDYFWLLVVHLRRCLYL